MDTRLKIKEALRECYGEFDTYLELEYENKITENLLNGSMSQKREWATYNQVILELKHSIKDNLKVKELQYRLTDKSNPGEVCIDVIRDIPQRSAELERLFNKIRNF